MTPDALSQLLILYGWFLLAALILFLLLIARFYQRFSNESTHFRLFLLPVLLFGAGAVRQTSVNAPGTDALASVMIGVGGAILALLSLLLYRRMTAGR